MKKTIELIILFIPFICISQVGIKTASPITNLHINGDMQAAKELKVGGTDKTPGNPGNPGQLLKSNGPGIAPEWVSLDIPNFEVGAYFQSDSNVYLDKEGIILTNESGKRKYEEDEDINYVPPTNKNAIWHQIKGLENTIKVTKKVNKINIIFQTTGHLGSTKDIVPKFTYGIGIFINDKLKIVKVYKVEGTNSFEIQTLIGTIEDLPIGKHTMKIAVIPRLKEEGYKGHLALGRPNTGSTNLSSFMTNTTLLVDVYEKPEIQ